MQLITGTIMVLLGFWAISPDNATVATYRGAVLLVVWIGVAALFRGISDIIVGFRLRSAHTGTRSSHRQLTPAPSGIGCTWHHG